MPGIRLAAEDDVVSGTAIGGVVTDAHLDVVVVLGAHEHLSRIGAHVEAAVLVDGGAVGADVEDVVLVHRDVVARQDRGINRADRVQGRQERRHGAIRRGQAVVQGQREDVFRDGAVGLRRGPARRPDADADIVRFIDDGDAGLVDTILRHARTEGVGVASMGVDLLTVLVLVGTELRQQEVRARRARRDAG